MSPALDLQDVSVHFGNRHRGGRRSSGSVSALTNVTLSIARGERVAMVGRSGAGKSTVARLACGLVKPTEGAVSTLGMSLAGSSKQELRSLRRRMHLVFQDPYQSLHPGLRVRDLVAEPLVIAGQPHTSEQLEDAVDAALAEVGLTPPSEFRDRRPATLSGGQRQRVAIARALVAKPELILADEPTSMLDASLRASIANLLLDLQRQIDAALVFITHDLALARHVADRIVVLQDGAIVEDRPTEELLADPQQAETQALLAAARHSAKHQSTTSA